MSTVGTGPAPRPAHYPRHLSNQRPSGDRRAPPLAMAAAAGAVAVLVGTLLPWARSGRVTRSGFALAGSLRAAGFVDTPPRRALLVALQLTPVLVAAAWTAAVLRRPGLAAVLAVADGAIGVGAAVVALRVAHSHALGGAVATVLAGIATTGLGLAGLVRQRSAYAR
ncbi:MAG: hypothetical protein LC792_02960 [Actinobacteria bacterium]|nr:hypothetical protein [Actinomycetota bacterium]